MDRKLAGVLFAGLLTAACGSDATPKDTGTTPNTGTNVATNSGNNSAVDDTCPERLYDVDGSCVAPDRIFEMSVGVSLADGESDRRARVCSDVVTDAELYEDLQKSPPGLVFSVGSCDVFESGQDPPIDERGFDVLAVERGFSVTKGDETLQLAAAGQFLCAEPSTVPESFFDYGETYTFRSVGTDAPEFEQTIQVPNAPNFEAPDIVKGEDLVFQYQAQNAHRVEVYIRDPSFSVAVSCKQEDTGEVVVPSSALDFLPAGEVVFTVFATNRRKDVVDGTMFRTISYATTRSLTTVLE